jgi:hypothetical protein
MWHDLVLPISPEEMKSTRFVGVLEMTQEDYVGARTAISALSATCSTRALTH